MMMLMINGEHMMDKDTFKQIKEKYESEIRKAISMIESYQKELKDTEIRIKSYNIQKQAFEFALKKLKEEYKS